MRSIHWYLSACIVLSPLAWAETKLDAAELQKFFNTGEKLEKTSENYPALNEENDEFLLQGDNQALIDRLKKAGALEAVRAEVKKSGYQSMDEYIDITKRVMAAYFAVQLQQNPEYSSAEDMRKMVESQKQQLKANGVAPEMIEQMMAAVNEQLEQLDTLFQFAETARAEDVAAVKENITYVNSQMEE